jgi:hypothetical protein
LKCGAEEEWRRSDGSIAWAMRKCYKESRGKERHTMKRKTNWTGHILGTNCLQKHIIEREIERRIEVKGRCGRRRKQLLDDLKKTRTLETERRTTRSHSWRTRFRRGYGPVVRLWNEWMNNVSVNRRIKLKRTLEKYDVKVRDWCNRSE